MVPEWTAAEHAIAAAVAAVEAMPGHPLLTDAVMLLCRARDKVADFVELPKPRQIEDANSDFARAAMRGDFD